MRVWFASALCAAVAVASGVASAAAAAERPVSFATAVALAEHNPRTTATRAAATDLQRAVASSPKLDANPVFSVSAGPRLAPGNERGFEGSLALSQALSLESAATLRKQALQAEAAWLSRDADAQTLARCLGAANAWLALWEAQEAMAVAAADVANERALVALLERLTSAQERSVADLATVRARLSEALLHQLGTEGMLADARAQLSAEINPAASELLVAEGALPELPALTADEQQRALQQIEQLPEIRAKSLLARSELVRAREERAARGVHLSVGAQLRHDALGATIVEGTLALPLPLLELGAREYASRSAEATRLEGEASDLRVRARAALLLAFHEVEHTQEVLALLEEGLLPAAERAVALRTRELEAGEGTLLELIDARRMLFEARSRRVGALRERAWARIRVRLLAHAATGTP